MFEDWNTLQRETLGSCCGTPPPPIHCLFQSLVKEIVSAAEGGRRSVFLHRVPFRVVLYSFVAGLNKYMWMHVKAMHSACVNFFFFEMPHKHKRNPFKRNK